MVTLQFGFMVYVLTEDGPLHMNPSGPTCLWAGPAGTRLHPVLDFFFFFFIILIALMHKKWHILWIYEHWFCFDTFESFRKLEFLHDVRTNDVNYSLKGKDNWFLFIQSLTLSLSAASGLCGSCLISVLVWQRLQTNHPAVTRFWFERCFSLIGSWKLHASVFLFLFFFPTENLQF